MKVVEGAGQQEVPPVPYCSTVTDYTAVSNITVSGTAYYAPRELGYKEVEDGGIRLKPTFAFPATYTIRFDGTNYTYSTLVSDTASTLTTKLANLINANAAASYSAMQLKVKSGAFDYYVLLNAKNYGSGPAVTTPSGVFVQSTRNLPKPIRFAEIMVKDSSGNIIQCGSTSVTGTYSLTLPQAASGSYTVYVNSRISNAAVARAYVMDYNLTNVHYSVSKTVSATATSAANNLLASGEGAVTSAAFNILDQVIKTNEYLADYVDNAHGCGTTFADCVPYTSAPMVYLYWKKGVNPYSYYGVSSGSSFYTGDARIFILGGINGDVDNSDTDHFDNSVIVHEYGHFLEDAFAVSESPGGYHNGNTVIDPRLAWSEGWSDFLQGAVLAQAVYADTSGNSSGPSGGSQFLTLDLESKGNDVPSSGSEGMFREFSITRLLWDAIDPHPANGAGGNDAGDGITNANSMTEIWTVFAGANGLKNSSNPFRHMGVIHKVQDNMAGRTSWLALRNSEFQNGSAAYTSVGLREYATPLVNGACNISFTPVADGGNFDNSDLLDNNDFLAFYHSGGTLSVQLKYTASVLANPPDLDLYVYYSDYTYGSSSTMVGYSQGDRPVSCVATPANCTDVTESVSASAPAGYYMINPMVFTDAGTSYGGAGTYKIYVNGQQKCLAP